MKITTARLKEIIKEEIQSVMEGKYGPARPGWPEGDSRDASSKASVDKEGAKERKTFFKRGLKKVGLAEIIDEELEIVINE